MIIHPVYFPPVYQYAQMLSEKKVLFEVQDYYQKQTYRNRMYIHSANGKQMLSVQVKHTHSDGKQLYKDVLVSNDFDWQKMHWRSLETAYRTSPYFEFYEDDLYPLFHQKEKYLIDLNIKSIEKISEMLDVDFQYDKTNEFKSEYPDMQDFRTLVNAKKSNLSPEIFPKYTQMFDVRNGFLPNLSVLDLLFMEGPNAVTYLENLTH